MPTQTNTLLPGTPGSFPSINGDDITVSTLLNPITEIPATIYTLVAENQGYFLNDLFFQGSRTTSGSAIVTEDDPTQLFLDADKGFAPRAPGGSAAEIGASHGDRKVIAVEAWSGYFQVSDEQVRRNRVDEVRDMLVRSANSYADKMQTRGLSIANAFLAAKSRTIPAPYAWTIAHASGVPNEDPTKLPAAGISAAVMQFTKDKAGIKPDFSVLHPDDMVTWDTVYGDRSAAVWQNYGLTPKVSVLQPKGTVLIGKRGTIGVIVPEKDMDVETEREVLSKSTNYMLDGSWAMTGKNAGGGLLVTGVS